MKAFYLARIIRRLLSRYNNCRENWRYLLNVRAKAGSQLPILLHREGIFSHKKVYINK